MWRKLEDLTANERRQVKLLLSGASEINYPRRKRVGKLKLAGWLAILIGSAVLLFGLGVVAFTHDIQGVLAFLMLGLLNVVNGLFQFATAGSLRMQWYLADRIRDLESSER